MNISLNKSPEQPVNPAEWESLLTYGLSDLLPLQTRLRTITGDDLRGFVDVRKDGSSADMFTILNAEHLVDWHRSEGRPGDAAADVLYESGLLYGVKLANTLHYDQTETELIPDDPDAHDIATATVKSSYGDPLIPTDEEPWRVENMREALYAGGSYLSLLNASLDGHIAEQMIELYQKRGLGDGEIDSSERVAFYRGLLDAIIYCNTYARAKKGLEPQLFTDQVTEQLAARTRWRQAVLRRCGAEAVPGTYSVETTDDLQALVSHALSNDLIDPSMHVTTAQMGYWGYELTFAKVLRQSGPNDFYFAYEVVDQSLYSIDKYTWACIGVSALALNLLAVNQHQIDDIGDVFVAASSGAFIGALAGTGLAWVVRTVRHRTEIRRRGKPQPPNSLSQI